MDAENKHNTGWFSYIIRYLAFDEVVWDSNGLRITIEVCLLLEKNTYLALPYLSYLACCAS